MDYISGRDVSISIYQLLKKTHQHPGPRIRKQWSFEESEN